MKCRACDGTGQRAPGTYPNGVTICAPCMGHGEVLEPVDELGAVVNKLRSVVDELGRVVERVRR